MDKQAGMTLFETTIVLTLAGLLVGGAIGANHFVESATAKALVTEMLDVKNMLYVYRDRYGAVPGDDVLASTHVKNGTSAYNSTGYGGDALIDANGSYPWNSTSIHSMSEAGLFWQHVRKAGLATGDSTVAPAENAVRGKLGITSNANTPTRPAGVGGLYTVCSSRITGRLAKMMDAQVDDGDGTTGMMWAAAETDLSVNTPTLPNAYDDTKRYTVCLAF